jgi:PKD repeat protein
MKKLIIIVILIISGLNLLGQTDTVFWFAVPWATFSHVSNVDADLTLTATNKSLLTHVTITQPYNPQIAPINITINPAVSLTANYHFSHADYYKISTPNYNSAINNVPGNSALLIKSDRDINAYFEISRAQNDPDIFSLKGHNALGKDFWLPFQTQWDNHQFPDDATHKPAMSQICIVTTQPNTTVTINFTNNPAEGFAAAFNHVIVIPEAGQTYMFVPKTATYSGTQIPDWHANKRLYGTHITSDKPIAVTVGDDSAQKSGAYDYIGDQLVPVINNLGKQLLGLNYIIMRGKTSNNGGGSNEKTFVLATQDNTVITVTRKGTAPVVYPPINSGQQLTLNILPSPLVSDEYLYIHADKPICVLHVCGFGDEIGGAIVPTIDGCTGSLSVSFVRSKDGGVPQGNPNRQWLYINLLCKQEAVDSFYMDNGFAVTQINPAWFEPVAGSSWYVLTKTPAIEAYFDANIAVGQATRIYNTMSVFHLGTINGITTGGGCAYGYFSDFNELEAQAYVEDQSYVYQVCGMTSIQLMAKGGLSYHWTPTEYLNDPNIQNPVVTLPEKGGFDVHFNVDVEQPCHSNTILTVWVIAPLVPNAFFNVNTTEGCGPIIVNIDDASTGSVLYRMNFGDGTPTYVSSDPIDTNYVYDNLGAAPQDYKLTYTTESEDGCNDSMSTTVTVYPQIISSFELPDLNDTVGCHPSIVEFGATSTGNTGSYLWDFGDGSTSSDSAITHIYKNFSDKDTAFYVRLISASPFLCSDTTDVMKIRVHPVLKADFSIDSTISCSPIDALINPVNSFQVDTFKWHRYDKNKILFDDYYDYTNSNSYHFSHTDNTYPFPDTIFFELIGKNRFSCPDTATTRKIIVFPVVNSQFTKVPDIGVCDSTLVQFTNSSIGYNLTYDWDFGNGNSSISESPSSLFSNRSDTTRHYYVRLVAESDHFCKDTVFDTVLVYPYVNAVFGVQTSPCTPVHAEFSNLSIGADNCYWNFGDDSTLTDTSSFITHTYFNESDTSEEPYIIQLISTNLEGCSDTLTRTIYVLPHVVAGFDFLSDSIGCAPLGINLSNHSSGGSSFLWDFGNGNFSTLINPPPRNYNNYSPYDTTYYISLTAFNAYGCDSTIMDSVTVFAYVDADFILPKADSCSPFRIRPNNLSSSGAHFWNWDLLNTGMASVESHTDSMPNFSIRQNLTTSIDTFYLRLVAFGVNDAEHLACADRDSIRVLIYPELNVNFSIDSLATCQPLRSNIDNNTNIPSGTLFQWYIDGVFYSSLQDPPDLNLTNITDADEQRVIYLSGESNHGCTGQHSDTITVYSLVDARFTINKSGICSADSFEINRSTSRGGITVYKWDWESDGTTDDNRTDPVFSYSFENTTSSTPDTNRITLTVLNSHNCPSSVSHPITVYPEVRANFTLNDYTICYPDSSEFDNSTDNASYYYWDFGDGTGSNDPEPMHLFENFSNTADQPFTIRLIARSQYNCYDSAQHNLTVYAKPDAEFYFPVTVDCPPFEANMVNESQGFNLTYLWDFGDDTSTEPNPEHIFRNETSGILPIPITLTVTSARGCQDAVIRELNVYPDVVVNFTSSESEGCSPLTVSFNGTAPNTSNLIWYIDGQPFSTLEDPSYRFVNNTPNTRTYHIMFSGHSMYGCSDDTTRDITVYSSPSAEFIPDPILQDYNTEEDQTTVTFSNETYFQDNWSYFWDFGDGSTGNDNSLSFDHVYGYEFWGTASSEYRIPVYMVAWNNDREECRDTVMGEVYIKPPLPKILLDEDASGCEPFTVNFVATTRYANEDQLLWDFDDNGATSTEEAPTHTYNKQGTYTVKFIVHGDGGTNWAYRIITVNPKPEIDFNFNDSIVFVRSQNRPDEVVNFYNHTNYGENYWWFFEETPEAGEEPVVDMANAQSTEENPTWAYEHTGTYHVVLIAESGESCLDTLMNPLSIRVLGEDSLQFPTAFFVDPKLSPRDGEINDPYDLGRDIFRAYGFGVEEFHLEVYNRWGVLVFKSDNINHGWNGYIDGRPAKQDVYLWRAKGRFTTGEPFVRSGDVTLIIASGQGGVPIGTGNNK